MQRWIRRYAELSAARPAVLLLAAAVLTAVSFLGLRRLKLNTNFGRLLPPKTPSVKASREVARMVGSTDFLVIAVDSPDPKKNLAFVDALGPRLRKFGELSLVMWKIDTTFFKEHGLLYLDPENLKQLHLALKERISRETQKSMGLFVDLDDEDDEDEDKDKENETKKDKDKKKDETKKKNDAARPSPCAAGRTDELDELVRRFRRRGTRGDLGYYQGKKEKVDVDLTGYLTTPNGRIAVILAKPKQESLSLTFVRRLVRKAKHEIAALKNEKRFAGVKAEVGGAYRNRVEEYDKILADIKKSGLVSALLIAAVVALLFRRLRPIPLIFIPLLCGLAWTLGIISLTSLKQLNVITAFIVGILLGLGIDFGVHMTARYLQERADGLDLTAALEKCLARTGRAMLAAAVTTAAALLILTVSRFKGFSEFGVVAGVGVMVCLAAFLSVFPPLAALFEKIWRPKKFRPFLEVKEAPKDPASSKDPAPRPARFPVFAAVMLALAVVFSAVCVYKIRDVKFEYNFQKLSGKGKGRMGTKIKYGNAIGNRASPSVALAGSRKAAREFYRLLKERTGTPVGDALIREFLAVDMFVPEDQDRKLAILSDIRKLCRKALDDTDEENKKRIKSLKEAIRMASVKRVTIQRLPEWLKRQFREKPTAEGKPGPIGRFVYIYTAANTWHALEMERFKKAYNQVTLPSGKKVLLASSGFVMVDVIRAVQRDTRRILILAAILVLLVLILDIRNPLKALLTFAPLAVGLLWTGGILALTYERLGLYNMVVLSTIVGAGIDAAVHLHHSYTELGPHRLKQVVMRTGLAVAAASITTAVGFAGMMISYHGGLASIGRLAAVGICSCLAAALIIMPSCFALARWAKTRKETQHPTRKQNQAQPEEKREE